MASLQSEAIFPLFSIFDYSIFGFLGSAIFEIRK